MGAGSSSVVNQSNQKHVTQEKVPQKPARSDHQEKSVRFESDDKLVRFESVEKPVRSQPAEKHDAFSLTQLLQPSVLSHVKPGNTLCTNGHLLLLQDGSTTIEFHVPPKFHRKTVAWNNGLIRDINYSSACNAFILLTRDQLFSLYLTESFNAEKTANKTVEEFRFYKYQKIKPIDSKISFWRCACIGTSVFISYSGFGTVIEEYTLKESSSKLENRWLSPTTCAVYEGVWCMRSQQDKHQIGLTIMDARTNAWRIEVRSSKELALLWQLALPLPFGDCELTVLASGEWLAVNSCGIRLIQIDNQKITAGVEYERELKNVLVIGKKYFIVRTKNTLEVHDLKKLKK